MSTFDLENPNPKPGDALRDEAANLLTPRLGRPAREQRVSGKKVDLFFTKGDYGKPLRFYLEAKDYKHELKRSDVVTIWADYSGIIAANRPATLLLVTKAGLTADAQAYVVDEQPDMRHQTIWELENEALGLTEYIRWQRDLFDEDGLSSYYIDARGRQAHYTSDHVRGLSDEPVDMMTQLRTWIDSPSNEPIAILGGYGAGKSSLAKRLVSSQATLALSDPSARRPVLIPLGKLARFSTLEGLLGGMFAHDHPVHQGFHVKSFLELNEKGRLLIVLDGFDEMKHAMSWGDFRAQITDLNRLIKGNSKVLLLGRPSAFTSLEEHFHVLRGMKRWQQTKWRQLPGWPEFTEYDLEEFSLTERDAFFRGYLGHHAAQSRKSALSAEWVEKRAVEVQTIANLEPDLFSKPVHAKILIDLAADPNVDLSALSKGMTRWGLYSLFFTSLAEREMEKQVRRPIGEHDRITFLREVAYWLWTKKNGATSFAAEDLPDTLFTDLGQGDASDPESLKREYLTGSFLEKKAGDTYYFGHRSFAEYLVAERLVNNPPDPLEQPTYSSLVRDGVREFLCDAPDNSVFTQWIDTLSNPAGRIHLEYLAFLAERLGGIKALRKDLPPTSIWLPILALFDDGPIELHAKLTPRILAAMNTEHDVLFFLFLSLFQIQCAQNGITPRQATTSICGVILERVFSRASFDEISRKASVERQADEARQLALAVVPELITSISNRSARFRGRRLIQAKDERLRLAGTDIALHEPYALMSLPDEELLIPYNAILSVLTPGAREAARNYFSASDNLSNIFTRDIKISMKKRNK